MGSITGTVAKIGIPIPATYWPGLRPEEVHVIEARTRGFLSRAIALGAGGAIAISGTYGLATGSYLAVEVVWAVAGPMFGALVTHYFGAAGKDTR